MHLYEYQYSTKQHGQSDIWKQLVQSLTGLFNINMQKIQVGGLGNKHWTLKQYYRPT